MGKRMESISIAEAHNRLSALIRKLRKTPITLTRRGKPVGVLLAPEEYERLRQFEAYSQVLRVSQALRDSNVKAGELYRASRDELEKRK
ncbi:MAG: type II toxin-antitoxin system Phd/YefM family antitoxin [Anaerolineales bacterium]